MINYYQELSISPDLDKDQIKKELNKLQRQWISRTNAPDLMRRQQAERMISVIEEANKILLDENKRQAYDLSLNKDTQEGYVQAHKVSEEKMRQENIQNINAEKFQYFLNEAWKNIKSKNYLEGINLAKRAVDINPNDAMAWDTLAFADREAGNIEDAVFEYKKAISIDPTNAQFYRELSYMCIENNKINEAQQYCNKALEIDNNGYENIYLKAKILAVRRDFQNAVKIFENLYKINPNDKYLIRSIADSYYNIALSFCYYQNNYYYCVNKENTLKMIEYLKKAKEFISMPEYDKKIEWGQSSLKILLIQRDGRYLFCLQF